ncbi:MAG: peroxiredoxin family protein [Vicinamibacterales bacterium]|nr:peroxiredoxin family protein [Vicinamibacterales bacterium]
MKTGIVLSALLLLLPVPALAQEPTKTGPESAASGKPGETGQPLTARAAGEVGIGERAPDFELDGSFGKPVKLSSLRGDWVMLSFGSRKEELLPLGEIAGEAGKLGMKLVGVCDEKAFFLVGMQQKTPSPVLLLADDLGEVAQMHGLFENVRRTILPGYILLDRQGIVRMAFLGVRLPPDEILRLSRFAIVTD